MYIQSLHYSPALSPGFGSAPDPARVLALRKKIESRRPTPQPLPSLTDIKIDTTVKRPKDFEGVNFKRIITPLKSGEHVRVTLPGGRATFVSRRGQHCSTPVAVISIVNEVRDIRRGVSVQIGDDVHYFESSKATGSVNPFSYKTVKAPSGLLTEMAELASFIPSTKPARVVVPQVVHSFVSADNAD